MATTKRLQLRPLDPLLIRDGRPFSRTPGIRAHTLNEVTPSVMAGTIRTMLAKRRQSRLSHSPLNYYAKAVVRGPLNRWRNSLYFPLPLDAEVYEEDNKVQVHRVSPVHVRQLEQAGQGFYGIGNDSALTELLWPPLGAGTHKILTTAPAYVSAEWMTKWLTESMDMVECQSELTLWNKTSHSSSAEPLPYREEPFVDPLPAPSFLPRLSRQERTHTAVNECTGSAQDEQLFSTESLVFPDDFVLEAHVSFDEAESATDANLSDIHTLGGERRLVHFTEVPEADGHPWASWTCPSPVLESLRGQPFIRMVLATPAYFSKGWKPGWLDEKLESDMLYDTGVKLRLRWACVPRWQPVSGWSFSPLDVPDKHTKSDREIKSGYEKAIRRMVPAGSVYFFEVIAGDPAALAEKMWLDSVSDPNRRKGAFDREDGCGLALWGTWQDGPAQIKST